MLVQVRQRKGALVVVVRRVWDSKAALLAGGVAVEALAYQRASADKKQQGKSVGDQATLNRREVAGQGWRLGASYTDNDRSASRYARRSRPDYKRLIEDITAGRGDVLVLWEIARGQRDLAVYVEIRDLCVRVGLRFWLVSGTVYDLTDRNDRMTLGMQAVQAEFQADYTRDNVRRGIVGAAEAGRPHAQVTYGYRRIYDSRTKALLRQEPDDEPRTAVGVDGVRSQYTPAGIVAEVVTRLAEGVTITALVRELNARGVPSPQGKAWTRAVVRKMALNPTYIGKRVLNGEIVAEGIWPALVDEAMFWAVTRMLTDPARTLTRPGRAVWLLSWLVRCGKCGSVVNSISRPGPNGSRVQVYRCSLHGCVVVAQPELDAYVQAVLVAWLAQPQVYATLAKATADTDQQAAHARAEAQRLRAELEQWRQAAEAGHVTPMTFARVERGLLERIALADQQVAEAATPPLLRGLVGPDAAAKWAMLDTAAKREVIRLVAQISVMSAGKGPSNTPLPQRVQFAGLIAGDQAEAVDEPYHRPVPTS